MNASWGRASMRIEGRLEVALLGAELAEALRTAELGDPLRQRVEVGVQGFRQVTDLLRRPLPHEGHRVGKDRRVGLRVRDPELAHQGLADHVVDREQRRVDRVAAEDRAERQGRAVAVVGALVQGLADQLRAAQRGHPRHRVGERRVERVGAVRERVHRAPAQLRFGLAGHRLGIRDHQLRANQALGPLLGAGRESMDAGHLGPREGGRDRRHRLALHRGDRLRGVDHPPAAEGDQGRRGSLAEERRGGLGHAARRHFVDGRGRRRQPIGLGQGPRGGEQIEFLEPVLGEGARRALQRSLPE